MKKQFIFFSLGLALFTSCSSNTPEETIMSFLKAKNKDLNFEKAYDFLTSEDKSYKTLQEFDESKGSNAQMVKPIIEKLSDKVSFEIFETLLRNDTVLIGVKEITPDIKKITSSIFGLGDAFKLMGMDEKERMEYFEDKLSDYIKDMKDIPISEAVNVYTLVKEDGKYKVFMNYGLPIKLGEFYSKIEELESKLQFEEALALTNNFISKNQSVSSIKKVKGISDKVKSVTSLNKPIIIGSLEFTPQNIEVKNVDYFEKNYRGEQKKVTTEKYFLLTYKVKNVSKAQVFGPRNFTSFSDYNFILDDSENKMMVPDMPYGAFIDRDVEKPLQPDQEIVFHAICKSPANENAENYLWNLQLRINNQERDNTAFFLIRFSNKDFKFF
jgi:hypothetical protein